MEEAKKMKCFKRLIFKQFIQVSGLCGPKFLSYLPKRLTHLILEMVIQLKIKRRDFFQRDRIPILVSRTVKTRKFKLLYFQNETCYRNGNLYNDVLFVCLPPSVNEKFVKPCYFDLTIWWRHYENHLYLTLLFTGDRIWTDLLLITRDPTWVVVCVDVDTDT